MSDWNDGGLPHGARKIQVYPQTTPDVNGGSVWSGTPKGIYILESWNPVRPSYKVNRYNEIRQPNGAFGVDDFVEADAVVQLATPASILLNTGDAFQTARAISATGGATTGESFVITNVGEPEEQGGIKKIPIHVQKIYVATGPTLF